MSVHVCAATDCGHGILAHRFMLATRTNVGECLCPGCPCGDFGEAQIALNARENGGETWDNGGTNEAAPGGASTPLIQGPRRLVKESTDG